MINDSECIVIWAIPDWPTWIAYEQAQRGPELTAWRHALADLGATWQRSLLDRRAARAAAHRSAARGIRPSPPRPALMSPGVP